jgi:hypothetical protein
MVVIRAGAPDAPPRPKRNALQPGFVSSEKRTGEQLRMPQLLRRCRAETQSYRQHLVTRKR